MNSPDQTFYEKRKNKNWSQSTLIIWLSLFCTSASVSYAVHLFTQELKQNWWYCYFILDDGIHKIILLETLQNHC